MNSNGKKKIIIKQERNEKYFFYISYYKIFFVSFNIWKIKIVFNTCEWSREFNNNNNNCNEIEIFIFLCACFKLYIVIERAKK